MKFRIGDLVTRISHKHDILFKIISIEDNLVYLKGVDLRLIADCLVEDLVKADISDVDQDKKIIEENMRDLKLDRSQYFYLPGKILHIDGCFFFVNKKMMAYATIFLFLLFFLYFEFNSCIYFC